MCTGKNILIIFVGFHFHLALCIFAAFRMTRNYLIQIHVHVFAVTQKSALLDCTLIKRLVLVNR